MMSQNKLQIQEGESLKAFSRRAEESLRGDINTAMRSASKKSNTESLSADKSKKRKREPEPQEPKIKHQPVDQRIAEKRAKAAEKSGNIVKEGVTDFEVAPRLGVNEVAEAPPSLGAWTKKSRTKSGKNANPTGISIMQQEALEKQRSEAIQRYVWSDCN